MIAPPAGNQQSVISNREAGLHRPFNAAIPASPEGRARCELCWPGPGTRKCTGGTASPVRACPSFCLHGRGWGNPSSISAANFADQARRMFGGFLEKIIRNGFQIVGGGRGPTNSHQSLLCFRAISFLSARPLPRAPQTRRDRSAAGQFPLGAGIIRRGPPAAPPLPSPAIWSRALLHGKAFQLFLQFG